MHTTKLQNISEYNVKITFFLFPPCYVLFEKPHYPSWNLMSVRR